ncbi:MAG TPA: ABC transporter permease [Gammaproteobacteria bacterium]|nr:ABC transporter permease [Gammaproteobacteria bacterium]
MNRYVRYTALKTIVIREVTRFMRIWPQTVLPPAITMTLYFVIFGNLIGKRIGTMEGYSYMEFITPGLIMMSVITSSYANVVSSFFSMKFQRSIEEILIAPVPYYIILLGFVAGGVARGLLVGLIVTIISIFFTGLHIENLLITSLVIVLTSILFSIAGMINALFARNFDDISIIPTFVLTPLTYLGGVFYSITLLPEFWQGVSMVNPILYMINAFRYGVLGISDINIYAAFMIILVFISLLGGGTLYLLRTGKGIRS